MKKILLNKKAKMGMLMVFAILFFAATNYSKVFRGSDTVTRSLIWNSENLVYNAMMLSYQPGDVSEYGLIELYPYNGAYIETLSDEVLGFSNGYSETEPVIAVNDNEFTRREYVTGNTMIFLNGDKADIVGNVAKDGILFVSYVADELYSFSEQGDLRYVCIYNNEEERYMLPGEWIDYESQIGLQGMIFSSFPKNLTIHQAVIVYKWALALLFAMVISLICYGIYKKYNIIFAVTFYVASLLAPWMIGYSTNLYWVEFTWFLPMLFGIYCANHRESRKARIISYVGVMLSVALKSACGYEFISTVMMSAIVFLLTDLTVAVWERRDKKEILQIFKTIFIMGVFALAGFALAMVWHAVIRGDGNIVNGLRAIYYNDVLRRTLGGDPNMFQEVYADSLNASILRVLARYLLFDTPLILGVPGLLFLLLVPMTFFSAVYGIWKQKEDKQMLVLYIWMGLASVSWFVLGKSHSYIHTGMNFVMWYFGFIQIVFYLLVELIRKTVKVIREKRG